MPLALEPWSASHLSALALTFLIPAALVAAARAGGSQRTTSVLGWSLAATLGLAKLAMLGWAYRGGHLSWAVGLPMHLCDWAAIAAILALLTRRQVPYELAYFWGLAGTVQAMLTPDLDFDFPDFEYFAFFLSHGGTIVAALFLTFAYRLSPLPGAVRRAMIATNAYAAAALAANWLIGANYGYLREKPAHASLLDRLGPWPWYILSLEALALLYYLALYAPFYFRDRSRRNR